MSTAYRSCVRLKKIVLSRIFLNWDLRFAATFVAPGTTTTTLASIVKGKERLVHFLDMLWRALIEGVRHMTH